MAMGHLTDEDWATREAKDIDQHYEQLERMKTAREKIGISMTGEPTPPINDQQQDGPRMAKRKTPRAIRLQAAKQQLNGELAFDNLLAVGQAEITAAAEGQSGPPRFTMVAYTAHRCTPADGIATPRSFSTFRGCKNRPTTLFRFTDLTPPTKSWGTRKPLPGAPRLSLKA